MHDLGRTPQNEMNVGNRISPPLFLRALQGIGPVNTVQEFQAASGISARSVALMVLKNLYSEGIGSGVGPRSRVGFSLSDRVRCAVAAIRAGCGIEEVSLLLGWRDFEALASEVLRDCGYKTFNNVRMKAPRMEVDVVGVSSRIAIAVDCKHWKRYSQSALAKFCELQASRSERLLGTLHVNGVVPVLLTLHSTACKFVNGVPAVPVAQFPSFIRQLEENLEYVRVISATPAASR